MESDFGNTDKVDFSIRAHNKTIYSGHAVRRPGQDTLKVRINDVCADYLRQYSSSLPVTDEGQNPLFLIMDETKPNTPVDTVSFLWDWSYRPQDFNRTRLLSAPVSQYLAGWQFIVLSYMLYGAASREIPYTIHTADGNSQTSDLQILTKDDLMGDLMFDFPLPVGPDTVYNCAPGYGPWSAESVDFYPIPGDLQTAMRYYIDKGCHDYALYYLNAFGGWDTLLLRGGVAVEVDVERHTYNKPGYSWDNTGRETVDYLNETGATYTLRTGWLTEEGAANIWHLFGSTDVMLYRNSEDRWTPLTLNDKTVKIKTHRGEGGKMISYEFKAAAAKKGVRR